MGIGQTGDLIWYRKKAVIWKTMKKRWVLDERKIRLKEWESRKKNGCWTNSRFDSKMKKMGIRRIEDLQIKEKNGCTTNRRLDWKNENQEKKMGVWRIVDLTGRGKTWVSDE